MQKPNIKNFKFLSSTGDPSCPYELRDITLDCNKVSTIKQGFKTIARAKDLTFYRGIPVECCFVVCEGHVHSIEGTYKQLRMEIFK